MDQNAKIVREGYRWILGRDPDPHGLKDYSAWLANGRMDEKGFREALLQSAEFAASQEDLRNVEIGNGVRVVVDANDPEFGRAIVDRGAWEPHIVHVIRTVLKPGQTFVDIGANVGVMAFHAADIVGPQGRVIAFEPNPRNSEVFQRGLLANGFQNVRLFTFAASDAYRLISLTRASNAKVRRGLDPLQSHYIVQADRLDNLLRLECAVDFIKIDIEGYELPALDGLRETISRFRPKILCEFNPLCFQELGYSIEDFSRYVFSLADKVDVIDHSIERVPVASSNELAEMWHRSDEEYVAKGILPNGWAHFDLLFEAG